MARRNSRRPFCRSLALALACMGAVVSPAWSQSAAPAVAQEDAELAELRAKFQTALEREKATDYPNALKLFRDIANVKASPQVLYHIAYCEEQLGHVVTALGGYARALEGITAETPAVFVNEVKASMEALRARIPKLVLVRGKGAEAAKIEVDGEPIGQEKIGKELPQDPGPHRVVATATGFVSFDRNVALAERQTERLVIELVPKPVEKPRPLVRSYGPWPFVIGGVGVLGLATGAVLLPVSQDKANQVSNICGGSDCTNIDNRPDYDRAQALAAEARTFEMAGWVAGGVGAALLGTGIALFFLDPGRPEEEPPLKPGVAVVPSAPDSQGGISLLGHF